MQAHSLESLAGEAARDVLDVGELSVWTRCVRYRTVQRHVQD